MDFLPFCDYCCCRTLKRSDILGNLVDRTSAGIPSEHHTDYEGDEIDLGELFGVLWDGKWRIAGITAIALS